MVHVLCQTWKSS